MQATRKLWQGLALVFFASFAVLLWLGREIYLSKPPIPDAVMTQSGATLYTGDEIRDGQRAWLAAGGQQLGTVWGHGSYVAPDWSADWLHREAVAYRDIRASTLYSKPYKDLTLNQRGSVDALVKEELRGNTYDAATNTVTITPERAAAIAQVGSHYQGLFGSEPSLDKLRES
jgi:nitric oxide reductase subunit B